MRKCFFKVLTFVVSAFISVSVVAENPVIQSCFSADPASLVYKDRFYIYAGRDEASPTGKWFNMREWKVYSSSDMVNWEDHGAALKVSDFKWASGDAWAGQCVYHKGKFYWYVSVSHKEKGGKAIGVAVSNSPTGPFVDAIGSALITTDMTPRQGDFDDIDPTVFVDDDGQAYMYWGNGKCKYVKLNKDMISFSDSIKYANVPKFGEAPWLQKIKGKYYLSYSSGLPSTIEYCIGNSPTGPWQYQNRILDVVENCPTSHQAITEFKGRWYLVYHNGALNSGGGFRRSVCIEEFSLNSDGTIPLIKQTKEGTSKVNTSIKKSLTKRLGGKKISSDLLGLFFEDINYAADGGLYAELLQNRSFEYNPGERREWHPFSFWEFILPGHSLGNISVETKSPLNSNNTHYIVIDAEYIGDYPQVKAESGVGLKNSGFDGIIVRKGEKYNFSVFAQLLNAKPMDFSLSLQTPKGEILAQNTFMVNEKSWKKYNSVLTANVDCDSAFLVLLAKTDGRVALDMVSLFPEKTFKNRPNGLRADLAQKLADMKPRFMRFPGGCLVHGNGVGNMYRWKNTIGPVEERKSQRNIWGYHQTAGLGYFEYFQFCEDIGAKPVPVLPAGVSCQNSGGTHVIGGAGQKALCMEDMNEYIQEVLDLVEWANGPVTSKWGAKRAAAGHPEPFNLEYIGIGNEDKMTPEYEERFIMIVKALKQKYPEIKIIGNSGPFHSGKDFDKGWEISNQMQVPVVDEHYYVQPQWFLENQYRYDKYDRSKGKVYLGEYASWGNKLKNALAEAAYITGMERNGDVVSMASYAPMLAKRNFTQWSTDMIFFDNLNICLTPNYHVQKMFMNNQGDYYYDNVITKDDNNNLLAASCVKDSKTGDVIIKLVNVSSKTAHMIVDLSDFKGLQSKAIRTILSGNADDENTFYDLNKIVPVQADFKIKNKFEYQLPAMSLTIIRIKARK